MCNGILSKLRAVGLAAMLVVGVAACDSNVTVDPASGAQMRSDKWPSIHLYAARPHVLRAKLDAPSGTVWALHVDGIDIYEATSDKKVRSIRLPGWTWASEPYACPPDFTVGPNGDILVTSNVMPVIWRIDSASFEVTRHDVAVDEYSGKDIGFSGLTYSASDGAFFAVSGLDSSLWWIDRLLVRARPVALSSSMPRACGVSAIPRAAQKGKSDVLCIQTEFGGWTVNLAPDYRSGYVHPAQCAVDSTFSRAPLQDATARAR